MTRKMKTRKNLTDEEKARIRWYLEDHERKIQQEWDDMVFVLALELGMDDDELETILMEF